MELKILEAYIRDVGRSVARIDYGNMDKLNLSTGDAILVEFNNKSIPLKTLPLYPSDENKNMIRIDKIARENLQVDVECKVNIKKSKTLLAKIIEVECLEAMPQPFPKDYLKDILEGTFLIINQKFAIPHFGKSVSFKVLKTDPEGPIHVVDTTEFKIKQIERNLVKEFEKPHINDLCKVTCPNPNCHHVFYVQTANIKRSFVCVKCGSEWMSERKEQKKNGT